VKVFWERYHSGYYLLISKIFLPYRHPESRMIERQNAERIENVKYRVENLMQDYMKYLYQKRILNEWKAKGRIVKQRD